MNIFPDPLEYDWQEEPGKPDVVGAVKLLEEWRAGIDPIEAYSLDEVLDLLRPQPTRRCIIQPYDHRGHWVAPADKIFALVDDVFRRFNVIEMWAYDRQEFQPEYGGRRTTIVGYSPGALEIWGRMIIISPDVADIMIGERQPPWLTIQVGDVSFRAKAKTLISDESGVYKIDWQAIKAENFGHSIK